MKHLQKILVLALSAILVITACIPGTLASRTVETPEATAPETTAGTESMVPETTAGTESTVPETTVPETGTAASEQPEAPMEQKPVSTDERYTVSFDLGGGILTARGVDRSVTAAPGRSLPCRGHRKRKIGPLRGGGLPRAGKPIRRKPTIKSRMTIP